MDSPTSVLFVDTVEAQDQTFNCIVDDDDWDPDLNLATGSSQTEFGGAEVLDDAGRRKLFKIFERVDEIIPWDELTAEPVVKAEAAPLQDIESREVPSIILEVIVGRRRRSILQEGAGLDGVVVCKPDIGKIRKRRRVRRGDGTKRHGRPPDRGPFGHSESWNMGVYPGRGPALISRADMITLPPTTPFATTTLCPPGADEGVAGPVDVLKGLPRNLLLIALSGLSAAGNASPPTAKSGLPKSPELSAPNPANPSS